MILSVPLVQQSEVYEEKRRSPRWGGSVFGLLSAGQSLGLCDDHRRHLQAAALQGGHGHSGHQELAAGPGHWYCHKLLHPSKRFSLLSLESFSFLLRFALIIYLKMFFFVVMLDVHHLRIIQTSFLQIFSSLYYTMIPQLKWNCTKNSILSGNCFHF